MQRINTDFLIVGAGIVGLTLALNLKRKYPKKRVCIIDKEPNLGYHASGRNSGVLHAGFYYYPDSLKAKFTRQGNFELTEYCEQKGLKKNKCGKVVVTKSEDELETLYELKRRGDANGVELYLIDEKELKEIEPNAKTFKYALWSPTTSVVDPVEVLTSLRQELENQDIKFYFKTPYIKKVDTNAIKAGDHIFEYNKFINCAGLYSDKIAKDFGFSKKYVLVPFKGIYIEYTGKDKFINRNIYPVPNIKNPFLGVHFTVKVDGKIKIGPTAMLCFWRENYESFDNFNINEFFEIMKMNTLLFVKSSLFRKTALEEMKKYIKTYMVKEASYLVTSFDKTKFNKWGKPGIRAQLLDIKNFQLVHDFVIEGDKNSVHILNAVSPAFTASLPFTRYIVENYLKEEQ